LYCTVLYGTPLPSNANPDRKGGPNASKFLKRILIKIYFGFYVLFILWVLLSEGGVLQPEDMWLNYAKMGLEEDKP
jgi:hypothetical protein